MFKFGLLTQIDFEGKSMKEGKGTRIKYKFKCDCGKEKYLRLGSVKRGEYKSCGCLLGYHLKTHGMSLTKFYKKWASIITRCNNKKSLEYKNYGGRGIKIERNKFEDFKKDMYKSYLKHVEEYGEKETTIDRIDVNGNYCKENCRWATMKEQNNNKTNNHIISHEGKIMNITQRAYFLGIKRNTIVSRIKRGRSDIDSITIISNKNNSIK